MKEFIEFLLKQIVSDPDAVVVTETKNGEIFDYRISINPNDMGLVIGKEGRTIKSLRSLAKAKAIKDNIRVNIELAETNALNAQI
ncbi:MAG TPA: KH domain-containing protein [Candidatus Saccharimonadales bacterium]|nr:KH domain-containing protein [Candidatus Saccharimonadales bacterium]